MSWDDVEQAHHMIQQAGKHCWLEKEEKRWRSGDFALTEVRWLATFAVLRQQIWL